MKLIKIILVLILFALLLMIAYLNQDEVTVGYFFERFLYNVPLFAVIFASILIGMAIAGMISASDQIKKTLSIRQLNQQIAKLEKEINSLRGLQISESDEAEPDRLLDVE